MDAPVVASEWIEANKESFKPPICNKLMHKKLLTVMFVGGPNSRTDFHVDESSELFFQLKGTMHLPIIERKQRKVVTIKEGEIFLLPGRIPHSPQRPVENSVGLVIERNRNLLKEFDCMRWYTDFEKCDVIEYEEFFLCSDLGKDLVPVVNRYKKFQNECGSTEFKRNMNPPIVDDEDSIVPGPFNLYQWCDMHQELFTNGATVNLFASNHPDTQFSVLVSSEINKVIKADSSEVVLFQIRGNARMRMDNAEHLLIETSCYVVPAGNHVSIGQRSEGSLTLLVYCNQVA
jgi:3-hydroxyanthranilate 3,4-dioxygenase